MLHLRFLLRDGGSLDVTAAEGDTVLQAAIAHSVPGIDGACGGYCSCATCHVLVESGHRLSSPAADEDAMLAGTAAKRRKNSRLACQLRLDASLDGLVLRVPEKQ